MDRKESKKFKKEKSVKCSSKKQGPLYITDVKSFKENIKIKEILRNVKMNSSMRLKAPPGSKVMSNTDFNYGDSFEESSVAQNSMQILSATNTDVVVSNFEPNESKSDNNDAKEVTQESDTANESNAVVGENKHSCNHISTILAPLSTEQPTLQNNCDNIQSDNINVNSNLNNCLPNGKISEKTRERKLSLDQTILSRREGLSQSELDLHSIGKSPLERKSSFFKKTMDSFVKNTTEMFKKQNKSLQRHVSMSVSLQSLNDKSMNSNDYREVPIQEVKDATDETRTHLQMPPHIARSHSSLSSVMQRPSSELSVDDNFAGSQPSLENPHSSSSHSLNEAYLKATMPTRAISMSSGLNSPFGHPHRKAPRSNRVTWLASEGLTNYLRRLVQDEKGKEMQSWQSYQDFSCIPENEKYSRKLDTKGRRLSYQRAVSGEDPVTPMRQHPDSTMKRKDQIPEMCETRDIAEFLNDFNVHGVPPLQGFDLAPIPEVAKTNIIWASGTRAFQDYLVGKFFPPEEQARIEVVKELVRTEAEHINHLTTMIEVFVAAAHALQTHGKMLHINTKKLFGNISDVLNASLCFWNVTFLPMILNAVEEQRPFNTDLMYEGFRRFNDILSPYELYLMEQNNILEYYKANKKDPDFSLYLAWCYNHRDSNRLHLNDFLAKPLQRLTRYNLLLKRIRDHTTEPENVLLGGMENFVKRYLTKVNMSVRKNEECHKIKKLQSTLDYQEGNVRDEELDRVFKLYATINLTKPMLYCRPNHSRCLIYEANLRFRDGPKEFAHTCSSKFTIGKIEVRAILLTDMLLICKVQIIKRSYRCKLIRPIYMIDKLLQMPKIAKNTITALNYMYVDDLGSSSTCFVLTESAKDTDPNKEILKMWENKMKEAKLTYELLIWAAINPQKHLTKAEVNRLVDILQIRAINDAEETNIEREAKIRMAAIVHESYGGKEYDPMMYLSETTSEVVIGVAARLPRLHQRNHIIVHRTVPARFFNLPSLEEAKAKTGMEEPISKFGTSIVRVPTTPSDEWLSAISLAGDEGEVQGGERRASGDEARRGQTPSSVTPGSMSPGSVAGSCDTREGDTAHLEAGRIQMHHSVATLMYSIPNLTISPSTPNSKSSACDEKFSYPVITLSEMDNKRRKSSSRTEHTTGHLEMADRAFSPQPSTSKDF